MPQERNDYYKNKALSYASYKYANFMMPYYASFWADTMKNLELEIDDNNVDPSTPAGIGNLAGQLHSTAAVQSGPSSALSAPKMRTLQEQGLHACLHASFRASPSTL